MRKIIKIIRTIIVRVLIAFIVISFLTVLLFRFVNPPVTLLMLKRKFLYDQPIHKQWKSFNQISPYFAMAVIGAEDQNFKNHWGFDVGAIQKAIQHNEKYKSTRGASTISQQVAKNVFLWPSRTWVRKGFESYYTVLIELLWSKKRILEVYMNVVELGNGIYGVEAASEKYYHKSASKLTKQEAAILAASLPSPRRFPASHPSAFMMKRANWIIRQMQNLGGQGYLKKMNE